MHLEYSWRTVKNQYPQRLILESSTKIILFGAWLGRFKSFFVNSHIQYQQVRRTLHNHVSATTNFGEITTIEIQRDVALNEYINWRFITVKWTNSFYKTIYHIILTVVCIHSVFSLWLFLLQLVVTETKFWRCNMTISFVYDYSQKN